MSPLIKDNYYDFNWKGTDNNQKIHEGVINAKNLVLAKIELRIKGYQVSHIALKSKPLFTINFTSINSSEIAIFFRQLSTLLNAGIPLVQALGVIGQGHANPGMQTLLSAIKEDILVGGTLAESFNKFPQYFDHLVCNLIEAGENAGILEPLLTKIASYREKTEQLNKKIKKALIYPLTVLIIALIVTTILLVFVVPIFEDMYKSFGADLPLFTQWVVTLSEWVIKDWWIIITIILFCGYAFYYAKKKHKPFNYLLDRILLKLPVIGLLLHKSIIARFSRTLATLSCAGIPIVDALQSVAGICGNHVYYMAVLSMREDVATGHRLQYAMQKTRLFPSFVQQMIAIGEESGSLDTMLTKIADFYEAEVDNLTDNLGSLIEPVIMVILGLLIGGLVVAMYLPIFQMGTVIG